MGCPASAGIDPRSLRPLQGAPRLPRVRGDRPNTWKEVIEYIKAAPRPRVTAGQKLIRLADEKLIGVDEVQVGGKPGVERVSFGRQGEPVQRVDGGVSAMQRENE
jgi:hypothetical protein